MFQIGNTCIYKNYIVVYLLYVIWSMYSSDRMKTLIRFVKDYDKIIVFMDCQNHFFKYLFEIFLEILLIFFRHFVELSAKINVIGLLLRHKQRLREAARNDNSAWEIVIILDFTIVSFLFAH